MKFITWKSEETLYLNCTVHSVHLNITPCNLTYYHCTLFETGGLSVQTMEKKGQCSGNRSFWRTEILFGDPCAEIPTW